MQVKNNNNSRIVKWFLFSVLILLDYSGFLCDPFGETRRFMRTSLISICFLFLCCLSWHILLRSVSQYGRFFSSSFGFCQSWCRLWQMTDRKIGKCELCHPCWIHSGWEVVLVRVQRMVWGVDLWKFLLPLHSGSIVGVTVLESSWMVPQQHSEPQYW